MENVLKLVPEITTKVCNKCKLEKCVSEFHRTTNSSATGRVGKCKTCTGAHRKETGADQRYYRKWREKLKTDPKRYSDYKQMKTNWNRSEKYYDGYFKRKFSISLEEVRSMLATQNGLCANIGCDKVISLNPSGDQGKAVVDHNHKTGKVRALMCVRCNSLLGHVENDFGVVRGLIDYINKYN